MSEYKYFKILISTSDLFWKIDIQYLKNSSIINFTLIDSNKKDL